MTQMKDINRTAIRVLAEDIEAAVQAVAEKHGIQIKRGSATYGGNEGSVKLELAIIGKDGNAVTPEAEAFKLFSSRDGIPAEALNKTFGKYTFRGYNSRAPKYPYIVEIKGRKGQYKVPASQAAREYQSAA